LTDDKGLPYIWGKGQTITRTTKPETHKRTTAATTNHRKYVEYSTKIKIQRHLQLMYFEQKANILHTAHEKRIFLEQPTRTLSF
jgi:hypothetical protein